MSSILKLFSSATNHFSTLQQTNDPILTSTINTLPNELLFHIFSFLNLENLQQAYNVCHLWRNLTVNSHTELPSLDQFNHYSNSLKKNLQEHYAKLHTSPLNLVLSSMFLFPNFDELIRQEKTEKLLQLADHLKEDCVFKPYAYCEAAKLLIKNGEQNEAKEIIKKIRPINIRSIKKNKAEKFIKCMKKISRKISRIYDECLHAMHSARNFIKYSF